MGQLQVFIFNTDRILVTSSIDFSAKKLLLVVHFAKIMT